MILDQDGHSHRINCRCMPQVRTLPILPLSPRMQRDRCKAGMRCTRLATGCRFEAQKDQRSTIRGEPESSRVIAIGLAPETLPIKYLRTL
jgi:hypothetical protein